MPRKKRKRKSRSTKTKRKTTRTRKRKTKRKSKKAFPKWLSKYYQLRNQGMSKKKAYKESGAPAHYWK